MRKKPSPRKSKKKTETKSPSKTKSKKSESKLTVNLPDKPYTGKLKAGDKVVAVVNGKQYTGTIRRIEGLYHSFEPDNENWVTTIGRPMIIKKVGG